MNRKFTDDEFVRRAFPAESRKIAVEHVIGSLENIAGGLRNLGKPVSHANVLRSLAGEDECEPYPRLHFLVHNEPLPSRGRVGSARLRAMVAVSGEWGEGLAEANNPRRSIRAALRLLCESPCN